MTPAAIASVAAGIGVRLTMSSSPITTRITGHRSVSRSRRSTEITLVFASSARTPMRISRPGQKKLLYCRMDYYLLRVRTISQTPSRMRSTGHTTSNLSQVRALTLFRRKKTPTTTSTTGQKYSRLHAIASILTLAARSRPVVHLVGADDVGIAVGAEVEEAGPGARLRESTIGTALLPQLAVQECVPQVVREHQQRRRIWVRVADGFEGAHVEGHRHRCRPRFGGWIQGLGLRCCVSVHIALWERAYEFCQQLTHLRHRRLLAGDDDAQRALREQRGADGLQLRDHVAQLVLAQLGEVAHDMQHPDSLETVVQRALRGQLCLREEDGELQAEVRQ